jgi:ABC-2 type transport system permease protein
MLILATLTTRFIFPLISLEGRRFWILGLSPLPLGRIMWQKFWLSVATTSVFTVGLAVLSGLRLELSPLHFTLTLGSIVATTAALSGLAVGLGSLYPNFEEDNPARITSGMGGTLNFILSLGYIVLVTVAQAVIFKWDDWKEAFGGGERTRATAVVLGAVALLTLLTCLVPMRLGRRSLERAEL